MVTTKKPIKYVDARDPIVTSATTKKPTVDSNPLRELLGKWPVVKSGINARLNETVTSIRDQFEANVLAIENLVNSGINKPNEYIGNAAHALVTTMALLVKNIEQQLERLSYGSAESTKEPSAEKLQWPSAKNPLSQVLTRWPTVKSGLIARVNEKVKSIRDELESQVAAIQNIGNSVMEQPNEYTGEASTSLVNRISEILGNIEKQLLRLESDSVKSLDVNFDDAAARAFHANHNHQESSQKPNVVHSEIGKKLRSMELYDMDAELRSDLRSSISDAVNKAQDKFNKLIDSQVAKINSKIADITEKFESAFNRFQDTLARLPRPTMPTINYPTIPPRKIYTPPTYDELSSKPTTTEKYTTIQWKPKPTTPIPTVYTKFFDTFTTPEYFKYTIPTPKYKKVAFEPNETLLTDLNRMDDNVDALDIVDNARDDSPIAEDDSPKLKPSVAAAEEIESKSELNIAPANPIEPIDELKSDVDTAKALDDLQSRVLESVKDTLKSDVENSAAIENNQSAELENAEDKLKSDMLASEMEAALAEELRNELKEDKLLENIDEESQIDNMRKENENLDDLAENLGDLVEENGNEDANQTRNDSENDNVDIDENETRSFDDDTEAPSSDDEGKE